MCYELFQGRKNINDHETAESWQGFFFSRNLVQGEGKITYIGGKLGAVPS